MYLILIIFVFTNCEKDEGIIGYDKIEIEPYILDNYHKDALQIYFDEITQDSNHPNYNNPILDETEITKILKIIQAVYNSNSSERDTVFEIYQIHRDNCHDFNGIVLQVLTETPEIVNLINNVFPTGDSSLDNILSTYNFNSVNTLYYSYPSFPFFILYTKDTYNMIPVENEFAEIESIQLAESHKNVDCFGFGDYIALKRSGNFVLITFTIGRGDCPSGCTYYKHWEFKVSNGNARFIRSYK